VKINTDSKQEMFSKLWNEDDLDEEAFDELMRKWEHENMDS
jgi:hypothetical protein